MCAEQPAGCPSPFPAHRVSLQFHQFYRTYSVLYLPSEETDVSQTTQAFSFLCWEKSMDRPLCLLTGETASQ